MFTKIDILFRMLGNYFLRDRYLLVVYCAAFFYSAIFSIIGIIRYEAFSYTDFDAAIFIHELWKVCHGKPSISILIDANLWGSFQEFAAFYTAPFYLLSFYDARVVFVIQSFFLGFGAIPIYLISCRKIPRIAACFFAFSYLLYPALWYVNLYEYNPLSLTIFTLLMAFLFLQKNRFGLYIIFLLLSLFNRLDVGSITFMFGLYALVTRKPWKWVIVPSFFSLFWLLISFNFLIPNFNGGLRFDMYYSQFGEGFGNIFLNMLSNAKALIALLFTQINFEYILYMFFPIAFLPLLAPIEFLICGFSLVQHLVSNRPSEHTIFYHYTSTIIPFVYIAAIYGMARFIAIRKKVVWGIYLLPVVLSFFANLSYGPLAHQTEYLAQLNSDDEDVYKKDLLSLIPKDAAVISTFEFSPMLAGRDRYYSFHFIYDGLFLDKQPYKTPTDIQYALINFDDPRMLSFQRENSDQNIRTFIQEGPFGVVDQINNVVLFKKGHEGTLRLYDAFPIALPQVSLWDVQGILKLLKMDHQLIQKQGYPVIRMSYQWAVTQPVEADIQMWIGVFDDQGREVYRLTRPICYGALPTYRWKPEYAYGDYVDVLLPSHLRRGHYKLFVAVFASGSRQFLPIVTKDHQGNPVSSKPTVNVYNFQIP